MRTSLSLVRPLTFLAIWLAIVVLAAPIVAAQTGSSREITGCDLPPRIVISQDIADPEHIRDDAFLVEEAFNQEQGEVRDIPATQQEDIGDTFLN